MNENGIGKDVQGACEAAFTYLKLGGLKLGFLLNFGSNLMKDGIEGIVNGLEDENLGVFASLRDQSFQSEPGGAANAASPHWLTLAFGG